ncbi:hypothetical protein M440DRAFT_1034402 [Trichoderma longibrachiatum ATCC 18648]|uniref:Uncharacterized protein n=1 Tax=Trichoderma longibrachiatum ATCC 18648 TaxID=983965 RepID=A0A2T4BZJ7_TRILO|nr:hypothetical protein M440DRAFT_1034402 [Trichoderma longibrachiatum ATCC 18648]
MVKTACVPPLHQEWAPSSNQAAVTQPGNRIPIDLDNKSSAPDTTAARDIKIVHLPSIPSSLSKTRTPIPNRGAPSSDSYLHP